MNSYHDESPVLPTAESAADAEGDGACYSRAHRFYDRPKSGKPSYTAPESRHRIWPDTDANPGQCFHATPSE